MASKGAARFLLRREIQSSSRTWPSSPTTISVVNSGHRLSPLTRNNRRQHCNVANRFNARIQPGLSRDFSQSARRRNAEEALDPNQVERESDEVDVCIVGGGKFEDFCALRIEIFD
jgi:electron-transferring-flavoprotein dehydrogenase